MALDDFINHNDGPQLYINPDEHSDAELCNLFNQLKENSTVERVVIDWLDPERDAVLGVKPSLALAAAISKHPSIQALHICFVERIMNFGAIAVAIQLSKTLSSFRLSSCVLSREQMAELEWLLAENGLESIYIECCRPRQQGDVFCIAQGLDSNQSLTELCIENPDPENTPRAISVETMEAIPRLIERSTNIESIRLDHVTVPPEVIRRIAEASSDHKSLKTISLRAVGRVGAVAFPSGVETLDLSCNDLSDTDDALALSSTLRGNTSLKDLRLLNNRIGSQGTVALANALVDNSTLKSLCYDNEVGDDGASAFAQALTSNTTLTCLRIFQFSEPGLNAFSSCLPSMNGLKTLVLADVDGFSQQSANQFLKAISRNTELENVSFFKNYNGSDTDRLIDEMEPKIKYQIGLNRAGKRILKSESHVPDALWPLILARSSMKPDALYFFLCEKPDVLINKPPPPARESRQRKRGWFGAWFGLVLASNSIMWVP